jgi:site-specific recombinase XerC
MAEAWMESDDGKTKHYYGYSVRQLGQYLTEIGHPKAFTVLSVGGNTPRMIGINPGPFAREIKEFVNHKRSVGLKYSTGEYGIKAFGKFCAMKENEFLTPQQLADAWSGKSKEKNGVYIDVVREFGIYLTMQGSEKSFVVPYANGDIPKPAFCGYKSVFAEGIESFLKAKRADGLKYRPEEYRLKDFDIFCSERSDMSPQQMAEDFIKHSQGLYCSTEHRRSAYIVRTLGDYLTRNGHKNAFVIIDENYIVGPYAEEISIFVEFKQSCGFKYRAAQYHLRVFDIYCALESNKSLEPQELADKWVLKRGDEQPNTRAGRVGPVRVFGKYLTSIGHPKAFEIAGDVAQRKAPNPPYLFSEDDIDMFFSVCAGLEVDEKDPIMHIVLPAAFLFMHCMGVRTCELQILMENVNFETGEVIIVDAKTGDRVVYMSNELSELLCKYNRMIDEMLPCRKYLFPASADRARNDFAKHFSEIWTSNIPDMGNGTPRLYDFRHHLLYRNVELCLLEGGDVNALRPYVMRHMGHKLPESFQYYFHLSPPIRREVCKIKDSLDWMIPDVQEAPYE